MFKCSPVYYANYQSNADIVINQGGADSGKTYAIMQLLFTYAVTTTPPKIDPVITIVGESVPNLKAGAYRIAQSIYQNTPEVLKAVISWNRTDMSFMFKNGWLMEFKSYETEQQAKQGKRQYAFFNEANGINYMIFWQIAKRTRQRTYIDYNPSAAFWVHEKLIGTSASSNDLTADVQTIISDHRHNPFLTEKEHARTEGIKDKELWWVYARGKTGNLKGLIFPNWKEIPDGDFPDSDFFGGLDFGYTNDPTAAVKIAVVGNNVFLHELAYEPGLAPIQLKTIFETNGFTDKEQIYCEHDPDQISQLRRLKLPVMPARKGAGSIRAGILKLNEYKVWYTASSKNIHNERTKYMWEVDKATGKPTNTPQSGWDHILDAIRYGVYTKYFR